jgi:error-prone DNA polymerase
MYIELHARSAFSFLEGASVPEDLIAACFALEMPAMALLDRDGVYGAPRFHLAAKKNGIKAHIGAEITVQCPKSKVQCLSFDFGLLTFDIGQLFPRQYSL